MKVDGVEVTVSPRQFDEMQRTLLTMEAKGHGPEACVIAACKAAGIAPPKPFEPLAVVVKA